MNLIVTARAEGNNIAFLIASAFRSFDKTMHMRSHTVVAAELARLLFHLSKERSSSTITMRSWLHERLIVFYAVALGPMWSLASLYRAWLLRPFKTVLGPTVPTTLRPSASIGDGLTAINTGSTTTAYSCRPTLSRCAIGTEHRRTVLRIAALWTRILVLLKNHVTTSTQSLAHCLGGCKAEVLLSLGR